MYKDRSRKHDNVRNLLPIQHLPRISIFTTLRRRGLTTKDKANLHWSHLLRERINIVLAIFSMTVLLEMQCSSPSD